MLLLGGVVSCAHAKGPPSLEEVCTPILSQILSIQDERNKLMNKMDTNVMRYKQGGLSKTKYRELFDKWLSEEGELRGEVTDLYDIAYQMKCL